MKVEQGDSVLYQLRLSDKLIPMNQFIGSNISIRFSGRLNCIACGTFTRQLQQQGYCFACAQSAPENSPCVINPEQCRGHLGEGRDVDWELQNHVQPHAVYLALTSQVKVGVTRLTQIPTRWIDQGAAEAVIIAETPNRFLAGEIEVFLKGHFPDKTPWQKMLKNESATVVLHDERQRAVALIGNEFSDYVRPNESSWKFTYPVKKYPSTVKSVNLEKEPDFSGQLAGMRGQYLMFSDGRVLNVRSHTGYHVVFGFNKA